MKELVYDIHYAPADGEKIKGILLEKKFPFIESMRPGTIAVRCPLLWEEIAAMFPDCIVGLSENSPADSLYLPPTENARTVPDKAKT